MVGEPSDAIPQRDAGEGISRAESLSDLPEPERLRLLTVLVEAFATSGYPATEVDYLRALVGREAFDALFEGKENCFLQVYDQTVALGADLLSERVPDGAPWPERLARGVSAVFELIALNPSAARLLLVEARAATRAVEERHFETLARFGPFMREGRNRSDLGAPPFVDSAYPAGVAWVLGGHLRAGQPVAELFPELLRLLSLAYFDNPQADEFVAAQPLPAGGESI